MSTILESWSPNVKSVTGHPMLTLLNSVALKDGLEAVAYLLVEVNSHPFSFHFLISPDKHLKLPNNI